MACSWGGLEQGQEVQPVLLQRITHTPKNQHALENRTEDHRAVGKMGLGAGTGLLGLP